MHRRLSRTTAEVSNTAKLEVDVAHLGEYDSALLGFLRDQPGALLPALENAASDALSTLLYDLQSNNSKDNDDDNDDDQNEDDAAAAAATNKEKANIPIQILLKGNLTMTCLRAIRSEHMHKLITCPGIVISASPVRCRATKLLVRCARCLDEQTLHSTEGPFGSISMPFKCKGPDPRECGNNPYGVVPDSSEFVDRQRLKLQEAPETVPTGELPRSVLLAVERSLVDRAPPGTRVTVFCIPSLFMSMNGDSSVRTVYLRVVGMQKENENGESATFAPAEEEAFTKLARRKDVYEILSRSVAPSISGSYTVDIKRALICMLFGGTRKRLPDGIRLRGDINVLLLGDPSTAKSQFLKFVSKVSPIGIYTSGKGSSAAGLTASVVKDARGEFYLEGGAMVLADGGIVCIVRYVRSKRNCTCCCCRCTHLYIIISFALYSRTNLIKCVQPIAWRFMKPWNSRPLV
jgi:DNA replication licensing factor MCM5